MPASQGAQMPPFAEPPPDRATRIRLLTAMDETEVTGCTRCPLHLGRTRTVFGEGDPEARLMFIGEGPGENEDLTGRPFVGRAGELLNRMIAGMGLTREQVFIANVVKCRPPQNRVPTVVEVATCTSYLHRQIEWIRPEVIVSLGLPATRHLLGSTLAMGKLRGRWHTWRGIRVMPTYHPAYRLALAGQEVELRERLAGDVDDAVAELPRDELVEPRAVEARMSQADVGQHPVPQPRVEARGILVCAGGVVHGSSRPHRRPTRHACRRPLCRRRPASRDTTGDRGLLVQKRSSGQTEAGGSGLPATRGGLGRTCFAGCVRVLGPVHHA